MILGFPGVGKTFLIKSILHELTALKKLAKYYYVSDLMFD